VKREMMQIVKRMVLASAMTLVFGILIAAVKPQVVKAAAEAPTVSGTDIYANETPIIIEAGTDVTKTRIKNASSGSYVTISGATGDAKSGYDLSEYTIYGGKKRTSTDTDGHIRYNTSVIMTGGKVFNIYGGNKTTLGLSGNFYFDTSVEIKGGTVTGKLYGGSYGGQNSGATNVTITGGVIATIYGAGDREGSLLNDATVKISGGSVTTVYGGGKIQEVKGNTNIEITGGTVTTVYGGGSSATTPGDSVTGNRNGIICLTGTSVNTTTFENLLYRGENAWSIKGSPVISAGNNIVIPVGSSMTIPAGSTLTINEGAVLNNNGTITIENGATLTNNGTLSGSGVIQYAKEVAVTSYPEQVGSLTGAGTYYKDKYATVTAGSATGYYFAGWYQATTESPYYTGKALSEDANYTFTVTDNTNLVAVYSQSPVLKATVNFTSFYGQVLISMQLNSCDRVAFPSGPSRYGYSFTGWSMTEDGLREQIEGGSSVITVSPVYTLDDMTYQVNVTQGTGGGSYKINDVVTAKAANPEEGMKFLYWKDDTSGKILSYLSTYQFYAMDDISITAYYDSTSVSVDANGIAGVVKIKTNSSTQRTSFVTFHTVPEDCSIKYAGIIATSDATIGMSGEGFTKDNATYVRGKEWNGTSYRFTWTKNVSDGKTWYVRAYLIYTDATYTEVTIYSDMEYASLSGSSK